MLQLLAFFVNSKCIIYKKLTIWGWKGCLSVAKCRGSWVVGRGRGSWVWGVGVGVGVGVGKCRG